MNRLQTAILIWLLAPALSLAATLLVPSQYPTIQAGINAAQTYDTVLVAAGSYLEHIDLLGKTIVVKGASGPELTAIVWPGQEDVVTMNTGEGPETVLEGFRIQSDYPGDMAGCGIYCGVGTGPTIRNNHIIECGSFYCYPGGGISAWDAAPHIEGNLIEGNMCVYYGAGIHLSDCFDVIIRDNVITANYTTSGYGVAIGGGIYAHNTEAIIERNLFVANIADPNYGYGGAIAISGSGVHEIRHNTFSQNVSGMNNYPTGGGICLGPQWSCTASIMFKDNILVDSPQGGGFSLFGGTPLLRIDFNDVWNNQPFNYHRCSPGPFDISADPLFEGGSPYSYVLTANSPCADAGSFMANPDPDGTRSDMGVYPYNRIGMNVTFQPFVWPISIPAGGGWFAGHFFLTNNSSAPSNFDFWVDVLLPDSSAFGPLILRQGLMLNPGQQAMKIAVQNVPGGVPAGNYLYSVHTGNYQTAQIYCEMNMPFTKAGMQGADGKWTIEGDLADWGYAVEMAPTLPQAIRLDASPNPFNPEIALSYQLSVDSHVTLRIYDISGRRVGTLVDGWRQAGRHELTWDAGDLPSGMYLAALESGGAGRVQKLILVK